VAGADDQREPVTDAGIQYRADEAARAERGHVSCSEDIRAAIASTVA
jgi:hypothetical protein